ncbi:MAG: hypothetical protein M3322_10050 [Actinomycetota bacterium]|nr:hypothetical protein [Actinomycetota bacterium]
MEIPKDAILAFLQERGEGDRAAQAEQELPDNVDTERDSGLLERFGIDQQDLLRAVGSMPGLKDKLPGGLGDRLGM